MEVPMKIARSIFGLFIVVVCASVLVFPAESGQSKPEVVAVMYGHANEGTWDPAAYQGLLDAQKIVPFKLSLSEGTSTQDAEKIIRNWAARGVDIIFAHSDIFMEPVLTVAKNFPKVYFICETQIDPDSYTDDPEQKKINYKNAPPNLILAGDTPWEGNYLAGYLAAKMSKTGKLGVLQPFEAPPLNRYSNCFLLGARAAKPDIKVKVVYIGDYIAPAETRDAVKSLAQDGCDVIFSETDDNSAILESKAQGIYCIPMYMDKNKVAPETVLTSVVMDWSGPLTGAIEAAVKGDWKAYRKEHYFRPLSAQDESIHLGKFAPSVPDNIKQEVQGLDKKFKDGSLKVDVIDKVLIK